MATSFFNRRGIFGIYALTISVLGAYAWHLRREEMRQNELYLQTIQKTSKVLEHISDEKFFEITKTYRNFPYKDNPSLYFKADSIQKAEKILTEKEEKTATDPSLEKPESNDSLLIEAHNLLNQTSVYYGLKAIHNQMANDFQTFYEYIPVVSTNFSCVRAGEVLKGIVYEQVYTKQTENISLFVNGQAIPLVNGIGKYQKVYTTAGKKTLDANILIKNLYTGAVYTKNQKLHVNICE